MFAGLDLDARLQCQHLALRVLGLSDCPPYNVSMLWIGVSGGIEPTMKPLCG
jgi:hypothetical protein